MTVSFDVATDAAAPRTRSEDRVEIFAHQAEIVVVVADGVGGQTGGAEASDAIVQSVRARLASLGARAFDDAEAAVLLQAVDADLARRFVGESTAVIVCVQRDGVSGASVGDSEAWFIDGSRIDRLTDGQDRRRIGSGRARPSTFTRRHLDGVLVVGSDGLFKCASIEAIVDACRAGRSSDVARGVIAAARLPSGALSDDVAVAVCSQRPAAI